MAKRIHDAVTIDNARWLLGVVNNNAFLCENILKGGADTKYIIEKEFQPFFIALQKQLKPLVYSD